MSTARYIVGDVFDGLAALEPGSVDLVLTSPPFLALRSYLPSDHPDKAREIGSEPTPGEFIDTLLDVVEACERVLAPHGSMVFELGDTYSGSGGAGGDYAEGGLRDGQEAFDGSARRQRRPATERQKALMDPHSAEDAKYAGNRLRDRRRVSTNGNKNRDKAPGWPLDKSLCLIPELFRVALVYGFNPLTGRTTPRWRARNVIRWCRPNPPVGALGDKVRPATSDMVVICKARDRWFDLDAVRTPLTEPGAVKKHSTWNPNPRRGDDHAEIRQNENGAPPLDHWWHDDEFDQDAWLVPTEPYKGSHYATWPTDLLVRPIKAMCPQRVCRTCGEPSRRVTASTVDTEADAEYLAARAASRSGERLGMGSTGRRHVEPRRVVPTGEWTDCGHDDWRPGHVLDPFGGSGTTAVVATGHGRDCTLIDLDERNAELARERVGGLFLTVEHLADPDPPATAWGRPVADIATGGAL